MAEDPKHIQFNNKQNPGSAFDLIKLEEMLARTYRDHSPFDLHLVEFYLVILIEEGEGAHTIDFKEYSYSKGSLLTIRKDQLHQFHPGSNVKGKLLLFKDDFLISYLEKLEALKSLQLFNEVLGVQKLQLTAEEYQEISRVVYRIEREYLQINDDYSLGIIRSELHILIAKLYRIKSSSNQLIADKKYLAEFIEFQNLVELHATSTTRVKDYAEMIGVSTKTLNTITQSIVNKTAKEFIDDISTKQIKRLLINTALSVKEIAFASGFEETTNFYKYFKRQTQYTPEQFRESLR